MEAQMALGPTKKQPTEIVNFRCPPDDLRWMKARTREGVTLSAVSAWCVGVARQYIEAVEPVEDELERVLREDGLTRGAMMKKLMALGLDAYKRESKAKR